MRTILLVTLLMGVVIGQEVMDSEPNCNEVLYASSTAWYLKDFYDQTFGIVHNITALQTLDVRNTNVFLEIQPLEWSYGFLQRRIYSVLRKVIGFSSYLEYMLDGTDRVWNEEEMDYDIPEMNQERSGTLEEMVRFLANNLEEELSMSDEDDLNFQSWVNTSLARLSNATIHKKSNKDVHKFLNDNLEELFRPDRSLSPVKWMTYSDKQADKLSKHLKNKAFFQKITDHPLNGNDILTFLAINPRVIQSPKIKPLLRMTLAKVISDIPEFDKLLFNFMECLMSEYGESSLFYLVGLRMDDVMQNVQMLKKTFEDNFLDDVVAKNSFHWVDLADAIFREFEVLDIDDLFYNLYVIGLKTRTFLLKLDIENKIYPEVQRLEILMRAAYFQLLTKPQTVLSALQIVQTEQFWEKAYHAYFNLLNTFYVPSCPSVVYCLESILPSIDIWRGFPAVEDMFKLELTEDGQQTFAATDFFRNYRKINQESIFQLKLEMLDPRTIILKVAKNLRRRGPRMYEDVESEVFGLFENASLFDMDWSSLKTVKDKMVKSMDVILMEMEK